jgi:hypothetical protein
LNGTDVDERLDNVSVLVVVVPVLCTPNLSCVADVATYEGEIQNTIPIVFQLGLIIRDSTNHRLIIMSGDSYDNCSVLMFFVRVKRSFTRGVANTFGPRDLP